MAGLREHIAAVRAHPLLASADIDFKVAESSGAASEGTLVESGFEGLRVAVCKVRGESRRVFAVPAAAAASAENMHLVKMAAVLSNARHDTHHCCDIKQHRSL